MSRSSAALLAQAALLFGMWGGSVVRRALLSAEARLAA